MTTQETKRKGCAVLMWVFAMMVPVFSSPQGIYCPAASDYCPEGHNVTGKLAFVDGYPKQPVLPAETRCFYLSCCTGDRPDVKTTWYKKLPSGWCVQKQESEGKCIYWNYRHTSDGGQTLVFEFAGIGVDSGDYMCIATDGQTTLNRTFNVQVVSCNDNPNITFQVPTNSQASVGSTYVQECEGNFGCNGAVASGSLAWWSYVNEQGHTQNLTEGQYGRYSVNVTVSEDETKKAAVLTIHSVMKEDFGRVFTCHLKRRDMPEVGFNFSITEIESRTDIRKYMGLIIGLCALGVIGAIVVLLTWGYCRPPLVFSFKSAFNNLPKRGQGHEFDVMLIAREEAEEEGGEEGGVLVSLREMLDNGGYRLHSLPPGQRLAGILDDIERCTSVIFIISTSTTTERLAMLDRCFSIGAENRAHMIFVPTQSMKKRDWESLSEDYQRIYTHATKLCAVAVWPGNEGQGSWLKRKNFWYKIRQFLPKPSLQGNARNVDMEGAGEGETDPLLR